MLCRLFLAALLAVSQAVLHAQCEPSAPVRQILDRASLREEVGLTLPEQKARRSGIVREALTQHPHDYFLLRRLILSEDDAETKLQQAASWRHRHPDQPVYELIHAEALLGRDTPEAMRRLAALQGRHPKLTRAHTVLVSVHSWGKFKDPSRARAELDLFLAACPAPLDAGILGLITSYGTRKQIAAVAKAVRPRLEKESDLLLTSVWTGLWRLEFKAGPPAEHAEVRRQIIQDLGRLASSMDTQDLRWLELARSGRQSAGDLAAAEETADEIVTRHPRSNAAKWILRERWDKQHPYPRNKGKAELEAWSRENVRSHREWLQRWPEDSLLLERVFTSLANLPDTAADEIAKTGDAVMDAYRRNPNWYGMPPVEFRIAREFAKRKVNLNKVVGLVDEGYRSAAARAERRDDRDPDEMAAMYRESKTSLKVERARVLLDYYEAAEQPGRAREIEAELSELRTEKPYLKSGLFEVQAHAAELLDRKLDALMLYRAALELQQPEQKRPGEDMLANHVERLWKELGGTPAARALLTGQKKAAEAVAESRWERPKNPLPPFALSDLEGKTWKLANLEGKAVLVNVWATWCHPCRAEHPEFQKLYESLKGRSDVAVLSFNVDEDLGKVAPYMKENKYTFPVVLANEFVEGYLPVVSIPQNWFLDLSGKLQWIQFGYGGDPKWLETMTAKLDEVLKTR